MQQLRKMATARSFGHMVQAFNRRANLPEMFISSLNNITSELNIDSVKSCLAMGAGDGCLEIGFIEKCTPNITTFVAIEQEHELVECLKAHMRQRLPDVEGLMIESDFKGWKGPSSPVDLVLAFNVLYNRYYSGSDERRILLKKVHDCWLTDGGFLAVLSDSPTSVRSKSPEKPSGSGIFDLLVVQVTFEEIEADILEVGFIKQYAHNFEFERDFSNPDDDLLRFFLHRIDQAVTLDDVRRMAKQLYPDGKAGGFNTFTVYKKAH